MKIMIKGSTVYMPKVYVMAKSWKHKNAFDFFAKKYDTFEGASIISNNANPKKIYPSANNPEIIARMVVKIENYLTTECRTTEIKLQ